MGCQELEEKGKKTFSQKLAFPEKSEVTKLMACNTSLFPAWV